MNKLTFILSLLQLFLCAFMSHVSSASEQQHYQTETTLVHMVCKNRFLPATSRFTRYSIFEKLHTKFQ